MPRMLSLCQLEHVKHTISTRDSHNIHLSNITGNMVNILRTYICIYILGMEYVALTCLGDGHDRAIVEDCNNEYHEG